MISMQPSMTNIAPNAQYNVAYDARVVGGQVCANGVPSNGLNAHSHGTIESRVRNAPTLTLDVKQMFGQVVIGDGGC